MFKLCRVDLGRSKEIYRRIDEYKLEVIRRLNPDKIILFGSFARGDINEGSDVDLIVVADWKENFLDRINVLLRLNKFKIPLEPIGYTKKEFKTMIKNGNPFILQVLKEGKILYQKQKNRK